MHKTVVMKCCCYEIINVTVFSSISCRMPNKKRNFLNVSIKQILFHFNKGHQIFLRISNAKYDLRDIVPWKLLEKMKDEKIDINVIPCDVGCKDPIPTNQIIDLDRYVLRSRRYKHVVWSNSTKVKNYAACDITKDLIKSWEKDRFALKIRSRDEAVAQYKRYLRGPISDSVNVEMNIDDNNNDVPMPSTSHVDLPPVQNPVLEDIMLKLFGSDSDAETKSSKSKVSNKSSSSGSSSSSSKSSSSDSSSESSSSSDSSADD